MKILIPIIGFGRAGGYRVLSELANHWIRAGHHVAFLVDQRTEPPYFPTCAEIMYFDAAGSVSGECRGKSSFKKSGNSFGIYLGMLRSLNKIAADFDVVLANHSLTAIPVSLARVGRAKRFYYIQAYEPEYYELEKGGKSTVLKWLSALSYRLPLEQIANAPIYIGYKSIRATCWIPPGLDGECFYRRSDEPYSSPDGEVKIGIIGRSEPSKGIVYALHAFDQLEKTQKNYSLKVAFGNLPENWSHSRAEVVVPRNDKELAEFYRSVDVLIAPGIVQLGACHYPVIEAMACGTPVITTGYAPADEKNSWLVPIKDSSSIVDKLKILERMPAAERKAILDNAAHAVEPFMWMHVSRQFLDCFDRGVN